MRILFLILLALFSFASLWADEKKIAVFVALADNKTQGIVPVPAAIGDGDDPEKNLYWGTAEGLKGHFDKSKKWKLAEKSDTPNGEIFRTRKYHREGAVLNAFAYRGAAIKKCIEDFESELEKDNYELVVFIGHNGLMDFNLPLPAKSDGSAKHPDCIVLCCKSESYFKQRILAAGARPLLLTTQLMYPGSFILEAAAEKWLTGASPVAIREAAAESYAQNQKITKKAALGIFATLTD